MPRRVVLIGHCGPDGSYLRMAVQSADRQVKVLPVSDEPTLRRHLGEGVDLLLINRVIDYGFAEATGAELIRRLKGEFPAVKMMLVSNYPDAQADAVAAGAAPGFGKDELGSPRVTELLRGALGL
jgi:hypothetical protein